jgi:hypothetical protein
MSVNEKEKLKSVQETETTPGEDNTQGDDIPGDDKKKSSPLTFEMRMETFRTSLQNAMDDTEFRNVLDGYGYGEARLNVGITKLQNTSRAEQVKMDKKALQHKATEIAEEKRLKAHTTLMFCYASTRLAYKGDTNMLEVLGLDGPIERTFGEWRAQAERYYEKTLDSTEIQAEIAKYNVPRELLERGKQELSEAIVANDQKIRAKGDAENATQLKNEAYDDLAEWMKDFYGIVDMSFKANPQLKEKVKMVVPYRY